MADTHQDADGMITCDKHRRESCPDCMMDFRLPNEFERARRRGEVDANGEPDYDSIGAKFWGRAEVERHALMGAFQRENPAGGVFEVGSKETRHLHDVLAPPPSARRGGLCARCGNGGNLMRCAACKSVSYCGKECQTAAWKEGHKKECKRLRQMTEHQGASTSATPITWHALEGLYPMPAEGKVLEIRVLTDPMPPFMRSVFEGKDRHGDIRRVAIYDSARRGIPGLAQGKVFRWANPRFHYFMDGSAGARIEDEDLPNIEIT
jgi:hypothetical protein